MERSIESIRMTHLTPEECWELLSTAPLGRVAFVAGSRPGMFPVNHWVHREAIVFQTAWSSALRFKHGAPVVFEVDAADPETRSGWSVLVEGTLEQITDAVDLAALGRLEHRTWAPSADEVWMRVAPTHVSGRRVERHLRSGDGGPLPYMHPG